MRATDVVVVAVGLLAACQPNPAPQHWLPTPLEAPVSRYGGWIALDMKPPNDATPRASWGGELLAVGTDSLWVLTDQGAKVVATRDVERGLVIGWDPEAYQLQIWSIVGTLSTVSNGAFLVFTAPAWIIGGSLATGGQMRRPVIDTRKSKWEALKLYARFPQGLPQGLDLGSLGTLHR